MFSERVHPKMLKQAQIDAMLGRHTRPSKDRVGNGVVGQAVDELPLG
jgi:hypothetical protein